MSDYADIQALNWSSLKELHTSPKMFQHRLTHPRPDKPEYLVGRAAHCDILEPERFDSRYLVLEDMGQCTAITAKGDQCSKPALAGVDRCGTPKHGGKELQSRLLAEHGGKELLEVQDRMAIANMAAAVREHPDAARLLSSGRAEETIQWTCDCYGIPCKARLDWLWAMSFLDFKTARDIDPRRFSRSCADYLYHGQLAWYFDGAIAAGVLPPDAEMPYVIVAEKTPPYDVVVYQATPETMELGRGLYRSLLARYAECQAADWWPGVAEGIQPLILPVWADGGQPQDDEPFTDEG